MAGGWETKPDSRYADGGCFFSRVQDRTLSGTFDGQIRALESPITRIFEGKFRSTLRAPGQKDSVIIEDWRALRLDIQVMSADCFLGSVL